MAETQRHFEKTLTPLLRFKTLDALRDGIFTPIERGITPSGIVTPAALIEQIGRRIQDDIPFFKTIHNMFQVNPARQWEGDAALFYVHPTAQISQYAVLNTTEGPIVIDAQARVSAFSFIKGPAYIGKKSQLDQCNFSNSICGTNCRLGGEIADSIIGDYSNKHHEGFLGHSLVGDWVNLGALTTTSDLKNNYGEVRLRYKEEIFPTGTIKFGSILGDYTKTAIGTLLSTGTIVDAGANLFGFPMVSGYIAPLRWGMHETYDVEKFLRDAARMMQRRGASVTPTLEEAIRRMVKGIP